MISLNWLKDYIDINDEDVYELADKITKAGVNVEKIVTNNINNLTIGEIKECKMHPDSDHLHVCMVDVGTEILQIVCGAPNVREGLKVIVSLPGAILPGEIEIKKGVIRGVESNGMLCALSELGLEEKNDENYSKGIHELGNDASVGNNPLEYLGLDDTLLELDVHKHRNNDCYYHIGFAYEIGAILNRKVTLPESKYQEISDNISNYFDLEVKTDKCPYYIAKMVKDVVIKESPEFIKKRLQAVGMRSINNIVDISNYVMLEYGQPLHFFDKDKLGNKIIVRDAKDNEEIITLDNIKRTLTNKDIVITDGNKAVAIAGVMGGLDTEIENDTTNILIESAIFDNVNIRNTANKLDLKSEASIRYGKGLSYEYTKMAIDRACYLLEKYADAKILKGSVVHDVIDKSPNIVSFKVDDVNKLLGITISSDNMEVELKRLGFDYKLNDKEFIVTVPSRRIDVENNVNDIAEEIGRLYGYHNLIGTLPKLNTKEGNYIGDVKYRKIISRRLRSLGLTETKTYTLTSPEMAKMFKYDDLENCILPNPMSLDKSVIRTSILPSLFSVYEYNKARKVNDILIYEISKTYDINYNETSKIAILMKGNYYANKWQNINIEVDFYVIKGIIENILDYLGFNNRYSFVKEELPDIHPGISARIYLDKEPIGIIGRVHPCIVKENVFVVEILLNKLMKKVRPIKYVKTNKYPEIVKDMAFIVDKKIESEKIINCIKKTGGKLLTNVEIFDIYEGNNINENQKSIAFSLTFADTTKTLSDQEVMVVFDNIIKDVTVKFNAILRDNKENNNGI